MLDMKSEPLSYGEIVLYKASDSSFVTGVSSDMSGDFLMENIGDGEYYVIISYIGYKDKVISKVTFNDTETLLNLETFKLRMGSVELAEIVVSRQRNVMEIKMDRKIFNVSKSLVSEGGDGLDVLRNILALRLDFFRFRQTKS